MDKQLEVRIAAALEDCKRVIAYTKTMKEEVSK